MESSRSTSPCSSRETMPSSSFSAISKLIVSTGGKVPSFDFCFSFIRFGSVSEIPDEFLFSSVPRGSRAVVDLAWYDIEGDRQPRLVRRERHCAMPEIGREQ